MQRQYATITTSIDLSTSEVTTSFQGVDDPEETTLVGALNALAADYWTVDGFLGVAVVDGTQHSTILISKPNPELIQALGHTWRR